LAVEQALGDFLFGQGQQIAVIAEVIAGGIVGDGAVLLAEGGQA
jgi:hypothetical protein